MDKMDGKIDSLVEKINKLSERLESHLQVAEFVDKNSGKEIKILFKNLKDLTNKLDLVEKDLKSRIVTTETDVLLLKQINTNKKENFYTIVKWVTLICVIIGAIFTLIKMGIINGAGNN